MFTELSFFMRRFVAVACAVVLLAISIGCDTTSGVRAPSDSGATTAAKPAVRPPAGGVDVLRIGDRIVVTYSDIPSPPSPSAQQVREDGKISLHLNYEVLAAGKVRSVLEKEIRNLYVEEKQVYREIGINIAVVDASFSVGGEVRTPGRFSHSGDVTLVKAINSAGGVNVYANRRQVLITRGSDKSQIKVDYKKALEDPQMDIPIYPGDSVFVKKSRL